MRYLKVPICLMLMLMLSACTRSRFMDLSGFIIEYNKVAKENIDFTQFTFEKDDKREYRLSNGNVLLTLEQGDDGKINHCKVMLIKLKEDGEKTDDMLFDIECFIEVLESTLQAFCDFDKGTAESIIKEFSLDKQESFTKQGELTKSQGEFYFVYYSTTLSSSMSIYNTYLYEIEPTEKPVSKPAYGDN